MRGDHASRGRARHDDGRPPLRRRYGQHFLRDAAYLERIVAAIAPVSNETLVEIGPGDGALTAPLVAAGARIFAVEIDRDLGALLQSRFAATGRVHVELADALRLDVRSLPMQFPVRVVGNLPYNITTPLLFRLLAQAEFIREMVFMVQHEVAERMCAEPGRGDYGRLSVMTQYRCGPELLFAVPPRAFSPVPKVDSAVIGLTPRASAPRARDAARLGNLVTAAFSKRRKTLRNALLGYVDATGFEALGIDAGRRPETLSVGEFVALANLEPAKIRDFAQPVATSRDETR